jgi:glycosyltransferase involved in cell wall biosynthesis
MIELSVVMPVFNEAAALPTVLDEALAALATAPFSYELVLLDDASTDQSPAILNEYGERHSDTVRVLRHTHNQGIAAACASLYASARGRYVFVNASDGQWRTAECLHMMALREQFDLVVGRRVCKRYGLRRQLVSGLFNFLPRVLFGVQTHDAGSIKLFRRDLLDIPLVSRGPFREAERIVRAHRRGFRIGVMDVEHLARRGGRESGAKLSLVAGAVADLARCWWDVRFS